MEQTPEKKTSPIYIMAEPSLKAAADERAYQLRKSLGEYIRDLIAADIAAAVTTTEAN